MTTVYVFKDKDGDYTVANSAVLTGGTVAFQLLGSVDERGGPIEFLNNIPAFVIGAKAGTLRDSDAGTVEEQAAQFDTVQAYETEVPEDSSIAQVFAVLS